MIGFTLAVGDFMAILVSSALWAAGGIAAQLAAGAGIVGGGYMVLRRLRRRH